MMYFLLRQSKLLYFSPKNTGFTLFHHDVFFHMLLKTHPKKEVIKMRRFWILITLICFMLTGPQVVLGASEKDQMGEYQKQSETKLKEFKQKVEELKSKAAELKEDAKAEFNDQMKELEKKQEAANEKLKELKSAGAKTWKKLKAEMDAAMDELDKLYDKTMSRFTKK